MIAREDQVAADEDSGQTMVEPDGGIENANFACLLCGNTLICKQADSSVHMVSSPNLPFYRLVFIFYVFLLFNRQCVSVCQYGVIFYNCGLPLMPMPSGHSKAMRQFK